MKKMLLAAACFVMSSTIVRAADIPVKAPVYKTVAPIFDWSGFYAGVYAGAGVQGTRGSDPSGARPGELEFIGSGFTGGGTLGYNWQLTRDWVAGIEGDIGRLGLDRNLPTYFSPFTMNDKTSRIATLRGRFGYSNGPTLFYATAGGAWVREENSISFFIPGAISQASGSQTRAGYAVGTGTETMLGGNWTAKAEFLHVDLGRGDPMTLGAPCGCIVQDKNRYEIAKFGVNYLLGGKTQPALPETDWSGFYSGVSGGLGASNSHVSGFGGGTFGDIGLNGSGAMLGAVAGYNWQFAPRWVAGIEGDFSWFGIRDSHREYNNGSTAGVDTNWIGTLRGRLGYSTGPALLYVTGGAAWVNLDSKFNIFADPQSKTKTLEGYAVGGGIETVLANNWLVNTEYLFVDAGNGPAETSGAFTTTSDYRFHLFRSALVYRFGT